MDELTNLLPQERRRALSREYFLRLGVVAIALIVILTIVAGLLLIPTHVLLTRNVTAKQSHLAKIESILSSSNETEISTHLSALSRDAARLTALGRIPSASGTLRSALAVSRPGVILSGFTYTPARGGGRGALTISGTATTRDALRNYQVALQSDPFATAADLPISAYAKDTDIGFTITVTLAL